jgi:hypothetical protein
METADYPSWSTIIIVGLANAGLILLAIVALINACQVLKEKRKNKL